MLGLSYKNTRELNAMIDKHLPSRPRFMRQEVSVGGEVFEFYYRDIIECIRTLFGDAGFSPSLILAPERQYTSTDRNDRLFHNMQTGRWWWRTQVGWR